MGQQFYVDAAALRAVADRFDATAATIDHSARARLSRLSFGGAGAGRAHAAGGAALRRALDAWAPELAAWSRAGAEIAAVLRAGAAGYTEAELRAATRVG